MSEFESKPTGNKQDAEKSRVGRRKPSKNKGVRFPFEDFKEKSNENLDILKLIAVYSDTTDAKRTAEFIFDKTLTEFLQSPARVSFQILALLSKEKNVDAKSLIESLIEKEWITATELKSFIPKRDAGRKKLTVNHETGKIDGIMKPEHKKVCELFNAGHTPEQVTEIICKDEKITIFQLKKKKLSKVLEVLRRNEKKGLLIRSYRPK